MCVNIYRVHTFCCCGWNPSIIKIITFQQSKSEDISWKDINPSDIYKNFNESLEFFFKKRPSSFMAYSKIDKNGYSYGFSEMYIILKLFATRTGGSES